MRFIAARAMDAARRVSSDTKAYPPCPVHQPMPHGLSPSQTRPAAQGAALGSLPSQPRPSPQLWGLRARKVRAEGRVDIDSLTEDKDENMISESLKIIGELKAAMAAEAPSTSAHEVVSREPPAEPC